MKNIAILFFHLMGLPAEQTVPVTGADLHGALQQANFDLKTTAVAPSIGMVSVIENYRKQDAALFESWLNVKERRTEIAEYRKNLQRSFEVVETAFPNFKDSYFFQYTDEARQLTVSYLTKENNLQIVMAQIPTVGFKKSSDDKTYETVLVDAANAFETMTHAPFATSIQEAITLINQMHTDQDPQLGEPIVLGDANGRVMMSTDIWSGITLVYLPRTDVEGLPDMRYWFGVYNYLPM